MAVTFGLVLTPWSFSTREGSFLERAIDEVGLDHLTIPVVTGEMLQFRVAPGIECPHFYTEGGWHYQPQKELYAPAGIKPRVARWVGTRDTLGPIQEYAARRGLQLRFRVDLPSVSSILEQAPGLHCRSAWGAELEGFGPCIWNPQFRELMQATLADLQRFAPAALEIQHISDTPVTPVGHPDMDWVWALDGLPATVCFCPACRQVAQAAGVDVDRVAETLRTALAGLAVHDETRWGRKPAALVTAYMTAMAADVQNWLSRLAESRAPGTLAVVADAKGFESGQLVPPNVTRIGEVDRTEVSTQYVDILVEFCRASGVTALSVPNSPTVESADELVRFLSRVVQRGVHFVEFEWLEVSGAERVTWLRQATRFARRESR